VNPVKIKIIREQRNELLKRNEISFTVDHEGDGTPSRAEIRQKLADELSADVDRLYLRKVETSTGSTKAVGQASLYDSVGLAEYVEPKHIVLRNVPEKKGKE